MKKLISVVMAVVTAFSIVACGQAKVETPTTETTIATEEVKTEKTVKIGLICLHDEQSSYDRNFINAFKSACEVEGVEYVIKTGIPESSECYEACVDMVDRGCNIVFGDSFGFESYMLQAAAAYPEVQFCHATGVMAASSNLANYHNAFAHIEQGRYLAGVAAGLKMKEIGATKTGYVGAFQYSEVISGLTAYYLGVKSIVPDATMDVIFTGSWYDESLEREAALKLIANGCEVISGHADSNGMPMACREKNIPFVGYNGSFADVCPDQYIISCKINWAPYFNYIINCIKNDEAIATDWCGSFTDGSVEMCELNENAAATETKETLNKTGEGLKDGSIKVFDITTFTVNSTVLTSHIINGNETIIDGEYAEGYYQSAPAIDFQIDGITYLTE